MIFLFYLYLCFIFYIRISLYICFILFHLVACLHFLQVAFKTRTLWRSCNAVRHGGKAATAGGQRQHESGGGTASGIKA